MKFFYRGAEAILYLKGGVLVKKRIKKRYRIKEIDVLLRKRRTRREATILKKAKELGIKVPSIFKVDEKKHTIYMEFIKGERVKEFFIKNSSNTKEISRICYKIGSQTGILHSHNIIHGDLTTSNMIIKGKDIYFVDFGLGFFSTRIEDKGVDLNLLMEALRSVHYNILNLCWRNILKGYRREFKDADKVIKKVYEIEKRARYVKKD
ncbi:MAG: Kae1-associated serine/threonine protein kinase [Candidatus Aenigmarchaeota archaeon]|nr:Kae1-associated serine/threonine protein kinase [Candidatus Aenigmarchaeota archaeon]